MKSRVLIAYVKAEKQGKQRRLDHLWTLDRLLYKQYTIVPAMLTSPHIAAAQMAINMV